MTTYLEKRNVTIDLLRALTMATMLVVNDFWSVSGIPHWMQHAKWGEDMLGFSDIVFPSFLFCVGLSIPYAITAMRRKGRSEGDVKVENVKDFVKTCQNRWGGGVEDYFATFDFMPEFQPKKG